MTRPLSKLPGFDPRDVPVEPVDSPQAAVDPARLTPQALRARLAHPPAGWQPESTGDRFIMPGRDGVPAAAAAVLVPIVRHPRPTVLLTQRTAHLSSHAGQVAFPGGRTDPGDRNAEATALREAHEEVGLPPDRVEIVGRLPDYLTGTNYRVTPVVGLVEPGVALTLQPNEVADAFEVPLDWLMDPAFHCRHRVDLGDNRFRRFWSMPWTTGEGASAREYFIWGATAAMLRNLYHLLSA